ncbi:MAG: class I SAM-dependent methyltransferase [Candidatus Brocadiia bacterium]
MAFENPSRLEMFLHGFVQHYLLSPWYRRYAESLGLRADEAVIELGSGSGALSRHLARCLADGGHLTCVDLSEAWTRVARKRLRRLGNVTLRAGDISRLDLPEDAFDAAVMHFTLHDIEEGARMPVLQALAPVLKPDGRLFIREPTREDHGMQPDEIRRLMTEAGLQEVDAQCARSLIGGPTYSGTFAPASAG